MGVLTSGCAQGELGGGDSGATDGSNTPPPDVEPRDGDDIRDATDAADVATDTANDADATDDASDADASPDDLGDTGDGGDVRDGGEVDDGGDGTDMDAGPCGGGCGPDEVCREGACRPLCDVAGASCGEVTVEGRTVQCGSCNGPSICVENSCQQVCDRADAECGEVFWGGPTVDCGGCPNAANTCVANQCVQDSGYHDVDGGELHTCAAMSDGTVDCWGDNGQHQLGDGSSSASETPVDTNVVDAAVRVRATNRQSCALYGNGELYCWGWNGNGQLGDGTTESRMAPVSVSTIGTGSSQSEARDVSVGTLHACATLAQGEAKCWGDQSLGRLGNGNISGDPIPTPTDVTGLSTAVAVASGRSHTCSLHEDGSLRCWGEGSHGRLGNGAFSGSSDPERVLNVDSAIDVGLGLEHSCAVLRSGEVHCWGRGDDGELGIGVLQNAATPKKVNVISNAREVVAGGDHTCAVTRDDRVYCWGQNDRGQLGTGDTDQKLEPTLVTAPSSSDPLTGVLTAGAGTSHTCFVERTGDVFCTGGNGAGQLGTGDTNDRSSPTAIQ